MFDEFVAISKTMRRMYAMQMNTTAHANTHSSYQKITGSPQMTVEYLSYGRLQNKNTLSSDENKIIWHTGYSNTNIWRLEITSHEVAHDLCVVESPSIGKL